MAINNLDIIQFYKNKRVLVTGHTGFKGAWLGAILSLFGANVIGYALNPVYKTNLYDVLELHKEIDAYIGDIRDLKNLSGVIAATKPEIVFHLAAQPLVSYGYEHPIYTYETNVMGTVNLLECLRNSSFIKSAVIVTTDKVYQNIENTVGYTEEDKLNGFDPYANSKSCCELVVDCYKNAFIKNNFPISTIRAGNVIGGGDYAENRIIPDCIRSVENNEVIKMRNPHSVRPYQHVLEALYAYITIAKLQIDDTNKAGSYNVGPNKTDCITTENLVSIFCNEYGSKAKYEYLNKERLFHESGLLILNADKIRKVFGIEPKWDIEKAIEKIVAFVKSSDKKQQVVLQIKEYFEID